MKNQTRAFYFTETPDFTPADKMVLKYLGVVLAVAGLAIAASAEDITIHLLQNASTSRKTVQYLCNAEAAKLGLPSGPFSVPKIHQRRRKQLRSLFLSPATRSFLQML